MGAGQYPGVAARGLTDERDRLLDADALLAQLQESCGGTLPGMLAVPELLALVRQTRAMGLRTAREFAAFDGEEIIRGFAQISPLDPEDGGGCEVLIEHWHAYPQTDPGQAEYAELLDQIDRATAEITARLDHQQRVLIWTALAPDALDLQDLTANDRAVGWTDRIELIGVAHRQPMHWRLLDGVRCTVPGSARSWRARLLPLGTALQHPRGFELLLVPDEPLNQPRAAGPGEGEQAGLIGSTLTPVLRQPIARIIANAETMRARLAGPLRQQYCEYATNIASAGQHLGGMLDDLADLEAVESPGFATLSEAVDLADVARRAAGILGVRAQDRAIRVTLLEGGVDGGGDGGGADGIAGEAVIARAEFRRVLQIGLNLIGNAIAYSPEGSEITLAVAHDPAGPVALIVGDEGPGINAAQAERIFDKFERLGRENDGGSGLGLYISRRLARAMGGDLTLVPYDGEGARFRLELPRFGEPA